MRLRKSQLPDIRKYYGKWRLRWVDSNGVERVWLFQKYRAAVRWLKRVQANDTPA